MLDEIALKKHVSWDGKRFCGYEDDDSSPVAKGALVLMVVSVNGTWKIPCGYIFVHGLSGFEDTNLIKVCIQRLQDTGVIVVSLTCDVPVCHFSMLTELGACLTPPDWKAYFLNSLGPSKRIYILFDVCHILKLVRNTLGDLGLFINKNCCKIY